MNYLALTGKVSAKKFLNERNKFTKSWVYYDPANFQGVKSWIDLEKF